MTWQKGISGNPLGRKKGVREHLTKEFVSDLAEAWKKDGAKALQRVAKDDPTSFCKLAASLVPRDIKIQHDVNMVVDILTLVTQRQQAALETPNNDARVIEHVNDEDCVDTLTLAKEEVITS